MRKESCSKGAERSGLDTSPLPASSSEAVLFRADRIRTSCYRAEDSLAARKTSHAPSLSPSLSLLSLSLLNPHSSLSSKCSKMSANAVKSEGVWFTDLCFVLLFMKVNLP